MGFMRPVSSAWGLFGFDLSIAIQCHLMKFTQANKRFKALSD